MSRLFAVTAMGLALCAIEPLRLGTVHAALFKERSNGGHVLPGGGFDDPDVRFGGRRP